MKRFLSFFVMVTVLAGYADAQIIGATNRSNPSNPNSSTTPEYRKTGASLRISSGFPNVGLLAFDYQLTPSFLVGGGGGVNVCNEVNIPIFGEIELRTPRYKWSIFLNVKSGYGFLYEDVFFAAMVGVSYKNISLGFGLSTSQYYSYHSNYEYSGFEWILPMVSLSYNLPLKAFF